MLLTISGAGKRWLHLQTAEHVIASGGAVTVLCSFEAEAAWWRMRLPAAEVRTLSASGALKP